MVASTTNQKSQEIEYLFKDKEEGVKSPSQIPIMQPISYVELRDEEDKRIINYLDRHMDSLSDKWVQDDIADIEDSYITRYVQLKIKAENRNDEKVLDYLGLKFRIINDKKRYNRTNIDCKWIIYILQSLRDNIIVA